MRYAVQSGIIGYNPAIDTAGAVTIVQRQQSENQYPVLNSPIEELKCVHRIWCLLAHTLSYFSLNKM